MSRSLLFQPQHVGKFLCDGSKCNARCCGGWNIIIDRETYARYPKEISAHFKFDAKRDAYVVQFNENKICPFLTENKLCRLQLEHGEEFLSPTCRTYPRVINCFGNFFERSLSLSCPVAAEMILFREEPTAFEVLDIPGETLKNFQVSMIRVDEKFSAHVMEIQAALISILRERTLSIDDRLIAAGFFLDKIDEISSGALDEDALIKLIAAYESKKFLTEQIPRMIRSFTFDAEKFIGLMRKISTQLPDEIIPAQIVKNYGRLKNFRKKFRAEHKIFLENFLVNEIFLSCCPWRFEGSIANNFGFLVAKYKIFELQLLAAAIKNSLGKSELIHLTGQFMTQVSHVEEYQRRIFLSIRNAGDIPDFIESLLEGSD